MRSDSATSAFLATLWTVPAVAAIFIAAAPGCGGAPDATSGDASPGDSSSAPSAPPPVTVELGEIVLAQVRPLENSTLHVRFDPRAVASAANAERLKNALTKHRHQARDQVIVAVRAAESWEFDEPDLHKLRRRILLRLNRWLDAPLVEDVLLTDYRFRVD